MVQRGYILFQNQAHSICRSNSTPGNKQGIECLRYRLQLCFFGISCIYVCIEFFHFWKQVFSADGNLGKALESEWNIFFKKKLETFYRKILGPCWWYRKDLGNGGRFLFGRLFPWIYYLWINFFIVAGLTSHDFWPIGRIGSLNISSAFRTGTIE